MGISSELISEFVKITNDSKTDKSKENTVYGTVKEYGGSFWVQLDGSDQLTPITTTTDVKPGERVMVMIKNHTATVTGNVSSPSAQSKDVEELGGEVKDAGSKISEFEIVMAHKVTTDDLTAINASITNLRAEVASIGKLDVLEADIDSLAARFADIEHISATDIEAFDIEVENLRAKFGDFTDVSTEDLEAVNAEIDNLKAYTADFTHVSADKLKAFRADIENLNTNKLSAKDAELKYANIDFANITKAAIKKLFSDTGLINDLVVGDGTITGKLVGVTITGDLIEGNTVKADKLVVKGSDGLYYKLNFEGGEFAEGEQVPTDSLHGSAITAKSITAEKVSVKDLVAFGATIGGFEITDNSIHTIAKDSVDNTTRGIYFDNDAQFAIGDAANFFKYYKDQNGNYKLEISIVNKVQSDLNNLSIGGRNLLRNSTNFYVHGTATGITGRITDEGYLSLTAESGNENWASVRLGNGYDFVESELSEGDKFVLSFTMRSPDTTVLPAIYIKPGMGYYSMIGQLSTEWSTVYYAGTWKDSGNITPHFGLGDRVGTYEIKSCKIERGTRPTDWTPSPDDVQAGIDDAQAAAEEAQRIANQNASDMAQMVTDFNADITNLQTQIDGSITTWFYEVDPTNSNEPASKWTTTELKNNHLGDLYYNTISGYCYRWQVSNNVYSWQRITDTDVTKALADAKNAQDTADQKRRVFYSTPTPPYDLGDLWVQGSGGEIMRCSVAKATGQSYTASDWVKASKYTDDTLANEAKNDAANAQNSIDNLKIGGRNLVPVSRILEARNVKSTQEFELRDAWATTFIASEDLIAILEPNTEYTIRYKLELIERTTVPTKFDMLVGFLIYSAAYSTWVHLATSMPETAEIGETKTVQITFTTPAEWHDESIICYSRRWTTDGASPVGFDAFKVTDFKIEKGNRATDWTPAPEDMATGSDLSSNVEIINQTIIEQAAQIKSENDKLLMSALAKYVESDGEDYAALKEAVAALELSSTGILARVSKTEEDLLAVDEDLQKKFNEISLIFSITVDGVTIGRTESPYKLFLDDNEFSMQINGNRVLWFEINENEKSANIPELNVTDRFTLFGLEGAKDQNGNINWIPIGG